MAENKHTAGLAEAWRRSGALDDIAAERQRQVDVESWSLTHDDAHDRCEISKAAAAYALSASGFSREAAFEIFPWAWSWWKPRDARADLVRAGALIVAEIERLDRATQPGEV